MNMTIIPTTTDLASFATAAAASRRDVLLAVAADAAASYDPCEMDFVPVGKDYAVSPAEIAIGTVAPLPLNGKEAQRLVVQATGALEERVRPTGSISGSAIAYRVVSSLLGLDMEVDLVKGKARHNVPVYDYWDGTSETHAATVAAMADSETGTTVLKVRDAAGYPRAVLRPTGQIVAHALDLSTFKKAVGHFTGPGRNPTVSCRKPADSKEAKATGADYTIGIKSFKTIVPKGKSAVTVAEYVTLADAIDYIARCGIRTVADPLDAGSIILPTVDGKVCRGLDGLYNDLRPAVDMAADDMTAGVSATWSGAAMSADARDGRKVLTGAYVMECMRKRGAGDLANAYAATGKVFAHSVPTAA
jgi:hypothetical protein